MKRETKALYGNCLFATVYLLLRGWPDEIALISSVSWFPWHFVAMRNGNALHFQTDLSAEDSAPVFFKGRFVGVRRSRIRDLLAQSGREVCYVLPVWKFNVALLVSVVLFPVVFTGLAVFKMVKG